MTTSAANNSAHTTVRESSGQQVHPTGDGSRTAASSRDAHRQLAAHSAGQSSWTSTAYSWALKLLFRMPAERIHHHMMGVLQRLSATPLACQALRQGLVVKEPKLGQTIAGIDFPRPLGLAAGFDKNARALNVWGALGFGFAEVGTVTCHAQPGNPAPRLFRLPEDRAILNRMGFNNEGALVAAQRLRERMCPEPIGVNLGKWKRTDPAMAAHDYRESARAVNAYADYVVINVSSPNTPGLRDLQAVDALRPIISAVQEVCVRPLFVKIAPDLSNDEALAVADLAMDMGVHGLIATNTTMSREGLSTDARYVRALGLGGISGRPVAQRSLELLQLIAQHSQGKLVLMSVGGIETPEQAWERITSGAHLLQGYTPLIYGGPEWIRRIHQGIARQLNAHGVANLGDAVGSGLPWA